MTAAYHNPVLLHDCMDGLRIDPAGTYVDVTFGGGGHAREILARLDTGTLIAFDQDEDALANAPLDKRFEIVGKNFIRLEEVLREKRRFPVDGILADLGVSSHQFDERERGFSTRFDSVLDMRMDKRSEITAEQVLNSYPEDKLMRLFRTYGEVENPGKLARTICSARKTERIDTTGKLKRVIEYCVKRGKENQYYAQVFQALRIEVNDELEALKELLVQSGNVLKKGGRLVVISYHSLEDRLVKNFMKTGNVEGEVKKDFFGNPIRPFEMITKKPKVPGVEEININSRARSAKLRIAEKIFD